MAEADKDEAATVQEHLRARSEQMLKRLPALGPVLMLYLQSPHRRFQFISDLEWLLLPPMISGQCKLYMQKDYPISFVSWAFLSDAAQRHLLQNGGRLRPEDWQSGDHLWIIDIAAPFGGVETVLQDLRRMFADRTINIAAPDPATGGLTARTVAPSSSDSGDVQGHEDKPAAP